MYLEQRGTSVQQKGDQRRKLHFDRGGLMFECQRFYPSATQSVALGHQNHLGTCWKCSDLRNWNLGESLINQCFNPLYAISICRCRVGFCFGRVAVNWLARPPGYSDGYIKLRSTVLVVSDVYDGEGTEEVLFWAVR